MTELSNSTEKSAVACMAQHFVALKCEYESLNSDGSVFHHGVTLISGFVLEIHGWWFWVTAGHCLKDSLDDYLKTGKLRVVGGGFIDYCGYKAQHFAPYPFTYSPDSAFVVEDAELGLDFAFIHLNHMTVRAFVANGVMPISRKNWEFQGDLSFSFHKVLGIPQDEDLRDENGNPAFRVLMCNVDQIAFEEVGDPPRDAQVPSEDWFFGRISADVPKVSLVGMSGGPIYGFRFTDDGRLCYHVVALQSRWWPHNRTIFGCPMVRFAEMAYQELKAVLDESPKD